MLSDADGRDVKLVDFGLSLIVARRQPTVIVGTLPYLAPVSLVTTQECRPRPSVTLFPLQEIVHCIGLPRKKMHIACMAIDWLAVDVWALGILLFTLTTGTTAL